MASTKPISFDTLYAFDRPYYSVQCSLPMWIVELILIIQSERFASISITNFKIVLNSDWWIRGRTKEFHNKKGAPILDDGRRKTFPRSRIENSSPVCFSKKLAFLKGLVSLNQIIAAAKILGIIMMLIDFLHGSKKLLEIENWSKMILRQIDRGKGTETGQTEL